MSQLLPKLVACDIDQTLTDTKTPIDAGMAELVAHLAAKISIAIVSGAPLSQCLQQVVEKIPLSPESRARTFIISTNGAALYAYNDGSDSWNAVYEELLNEAEKKKIFDALTHALHETKTGDTSADTSFGPLIEDRGSQVTFSALGANAPAALKKEWDPDFAQRTKMVNILAPLLPDFSIKMGGTTSIDITRAGVDKAYGLSRLLKHLALSPQEALYIGDALFPGGNDSSVLTLGVETLSVGAPGLDDTKEALRGLLARAG